MRSCWCTAGQACPTRTCVRSRHWRANDCVCSATTSVAAAGPLSPTLRAFTCATTLETSSPFVRTSALSESTCSVTRGGGLVCLAYVSKHPRQVASLTLVGTMAPYWEDNRSGQQALQERIHELTDLGIIPDPLPALEGDSCKASSLAMLPAYLGDPEQPLPPELEQTSFSVCSFHASVDRLGRYDLRPKLLDVGVPTTIYVGHLDPFGIEVARAAARGLVNSFPEIVVLPRTGHYPWLEQESFIQDLRKLMDRRGGASARMSRPFVTKKSLVQALDAEALSRIARVLGVPVASDDGEEALRTALCGSRHATARRILSELDAKTSAAVLQRVGFERGVDAARMRRPPAISRFVAIDFETADAKADSACAVALVRVHGREIVERAYRLIQPPRRKVVNSWVHGLTWKALRDAPRFDEVWPSLVPVLEGVDFLVAHNAGFDRNVLRVCCAKAGLSMPPLPFKCTVKWSRRTFDLPRANLPTVCEHLGIELDHHQALSDAEACARIMMEVQQIWRKRLGL